MFVDKAILVSIGAAILLGSPGVSWAGPVNCWDWSPVVAVSASPSGSGIASIAGSVAPSPDELDNDRRYDWGYQEGTSAANPLVYGARNQNADSALYWSHAVDRHAEVAAASSQSVADPVPEPATLSLLGLGVASLFGSRYRRRSKP